ncbi:MAG: hypothetical protein QF473_31510, partial [Planctomycetota bacterium]|nr:hypothetical protein [Planctomycetota bacterium]
MKCSQNHQLRPVNHQVMAMWFSTFFLGFSFLHSESSTYHHLRQGVTFYLPNQSGKSFEIALDIKDINTFCQGPQTMLLKVYAPDGEVLFEEDVPDDGIVEGGYQSAWAGWDHELWARGGIRETGAEPLFRWESFSNPKKLDQLKGTQRKILVRAGKKGVYQVQLAGCDDHFVKFETTPSMKFGALGHPDFVAGHGDQYRESFLYVPEELPFYLKNRKDIDVWLIEHSYPRTRALTFYLDGKPLPIEDIVTKRKNTFLTPGQALGRGKVSLDGIPPGSVLKLAIQGEGDFLLRISGLPAILCPDAETARQIAGGLLRIPGGPTVTFPFQRELWDAVKKLKKEDFTVQGFRPGEWYKPSAQDLRSITSIQWRGDLSPGGIDNTMKKTLELLSKIEPFDVREFFKQMPGIAFRNMAFYYLYPLKGNTLYHHPALRNLFTLGLVKQWMYYRGG